MQSGCVPYAEWTTSFHAHAKQQDEKEIILLE
jgi:hypothetical protein